MSYETLMYIGLGIGGGFFILSAILFFALKIPAVISELTGRTARREVAAILSRERDEDGRSKSSLKGTKQRKGGWPFGKKAINTANLPKQEHEAEGTVSYQSGSSQGKSGNESTVAFDTNVSSGSYETNATVALVENQSGGYADTTYLNMNQTVDSCENKNTVALPTLPLAGGLYEGRFDETVALSPSTTAAEGNTLRKDAEKKGADDKHETQRLDGIMFDQARQLAASSKNPDVYIEDRVIVVHTDELIDG